MSPADWLIGAIQNTCKIYICNIMIPLCTFLIVIKSLLMPRSAAWIANHSLIQDKWGICLIYSGHTMHVVKN